MLKGQVKSRVLGRRPLLPPKSTPCIKFSISSLFAARPFPTYPNFQTRKPPSLPHLPLFISPLLVNGQFAILNSGLQKKQSRDECNYGTKGILAAMHCDIVFITIELKQILRTDCQAMSVVTLRPPYFFLSSFFLLFLRESIAQLRRNSSSVSR